MVCEEATQKCKEIEFPADFEEHILPYCADQRHPADTLFLIAEEDWRLKESHCDLSPDFGELSASMLQARDVPKFKSEVEAVRGEDRTFPAYQHIRPVEPTADAAASSQQPPAIANHQWVQVGLNFHKRATKPSADEFTTTSKHLVDIVKMTSEAHRAGARDLLWLSWLPLKSKRVRHPTRYSGFIALTAEGARKLRFNFEEWLGEPTFFDTALRHALCENVACRAELSAGYLYPCLGHYCEHSSPLCKGAVRDTDWSSQHILQDTRVEPTADAKHWSIGVCAFTESGPICYLHPGIQLPELEFGEDFRWWTAAISINELPADNGPSQSLRQRWHKAKGGGFWAPVALTKVTTCTVGSEKDDQDDSFGKIELTAFQIWDETEEWPAYLWTRSLDRRWRMAVNLFHRRSFTNNPLKVA